MAGIVRAIDFVIDVLGAVMGGGPEAGFWRNVERVLIAITALVLFAALCAILAVRVS